jgi:hypothetical protein
MLRCATALLAEKAAVAQHSGPFFAAHTRSVSGVVAEFRYATLIANSDSATLR